jgi:type I restriction enzyme R subunit
MIKIDENNLELAVIELFKSLKYNYFYGPEIAETLRNNDYKSLILTSILEENLKKINPTKTEKQIFEAIKKIQAITEPNLEKANHEFHKFIQTGVDTYNEKTQKYEKVFLFDRNNPLNNDFTIINQFTYIQDNTKMRPDLVVFLNGVPIVVVELKNPADEKTTIDSAYDQIKTYQKKINQLFTYNCFSVISDGFEARAGSITADFDRFVQWKSVDGEKSCQTFVQIETQINGMFKKDHLVDIIHNFITFQTNKSKEVIKILAAYHQYFAVNKAIIQSRRAYNDGSRKVGVVWHSTGSGKSFSMTFYTGKLINEFENPTIIVLTDRNDLDDQLYTTFSSSRDILKQTPQQAKSRSDLKDLLHKRESGGIIFTTIQKFLLEKEKIEADLLSDRKNIFIIADEAHRSQYDFIDGYAKHMRDSLPNASFIGFTGTPLESSDKNTSVVFGDYIDKYTMAQSVADKTTVPIFYESRLAKLGLEEKYLTKLDEELDEVNEAGESINEKAKKKWAQLEAIVGNKNRLKLVAKDFIEHFESRNSNFKSKVMFVCMSRRICVDFYNILKELRPDWHSDKNTEGKIKIIFSGSSSDKLEFQDHIRKKSDQDKIAQRFKDENNDLEIVLVRDMWLTGFDVPCVNTMYIDKPIKGHNLIQAISRVNRIHKDKEAGLVVDYIGIGQFLKSAVSFYSSQDKKVIGEEINESITIMIDKFDLVNSLFNKFDYSGYNDVKIKFLDRLKFVQKGADYIFGLNKKQKELFLKSTYELIKAHSLCPLSDEAKKIVLDIKFFQAVRAAIMKFETRETKTTEINLDDKLQQLLSEAVTGKKVIDIYDIAGIEKPELSILSDDFLQELTGKENKNLTFELLKKLINDEIKTTCKGNLALQLKFSEMLKNTILKYENRTIETAKVIQELIEMAKHIKNSPSEADRLKLDYEEFAFYMALGDLDEVKQVMGEDVLKEIAVKLVAEIRDKKTVDWDKRESARAKMRLIIKKLLRSYRYPPESCDKAIKLVMQQVQETTNNTEIN